MKIASWIIFKRESDGKVLVTRRSSSTRHKGEWNFPGGSSLKYSPLQLARKEALEEVGIDITNLNCLKILVMGTNTKVHHFFLVSMKDTPVELNHEADKHKWCKLKKLKRIRNRHKSLDIFLKNKSYVREIKEDTNIWFRKNSRKGLD